MTINVIILCPGKFAVDVADLISDIPDVNVVGFAQSIPPYTPGSTFLDRPIWWIDDLPGLSRDTHVICAHTRIKRYRFIEQVEAMGFPFYTLIHPTARVSRRAVIGRGTIISSGVQVAADATIGDHVVVNRAASIGHHTTVNNLATVAPGATLASRIVVGARAYIGMGANILEGSTIGYGAVVGAGALVTKDVPERTKVMGLPARVVEENIDGL